MASVNAMARIMFVWIGPAASGLRPERLHRLGREHTDTYGGTKGPEAYR